jgi:hypothetical protein
VALSYAIVAGFLFALSPKGSELFKFPAAGKKAAASTPAE